MPCTTNLVLAKARATMWAKDRGVEITKYPNIGVSDDHVAMFLVVTDSNFCFVEPMVTNPESSSKDRHKSSGEVYNKIESIAKSIGYKKIYGMTKSAGVLTKAHNQGLEKSEFNLIEKEI